MKRMRVSLYNHQQMARSRDRHTVAPKPNSRSSRAAAPAHINLEFLHHGHDLGEDVVDGTTPRYEEGGPMVDVMRDHGRVHALCRDVRTSLCGRISTSAKERSNP